MEIQRILDSTEVSTPIVTSSSERLQVYTRPRSRAQGEVRICKINDGKGTHDATSVEEILAYESSH